MAILDFIFRYTWLIMIATCYIIWSIISIKDIIDTKRIFSDDFTLDYIDPPSMLWIITTGMLVFCKFCILALVLMNEKGDMMDFIEFCEDVLGHPLSD